MGREINITREDTIIAHDSHERIDSTLESPMTESAQWSDTGISSLDATGDKFSKGRRMHLELQDTITDTDIEYSEMSPSPVGQGQVLPTSESPFNGTLGKIQINVLRARDIEKRGKFGTADPYVKISLGKQKAKSATVKNDLNPEWGFTETFDIDSHSPQELLVEVFDEDIGKDDFLGKVTIDLNNILHNSLSENTWVPLESCTSGELLLSADFIPATIPTSSTPISGKVKRALESSMKELDDECDRDISKSLSRDESLSMDRSVESSTFLPNTPGSETFREEDFIEVDPNSHISQRGMPQKTFPGGKTNMTLIKAKELRKKDIFSKSDPYEVISVGSQRQKTKTMKNTHEPEWNHEIHIEERSSAGTEVKIHIFNKKSLAKDDSLGYIIFNTKELFRQPNLINRWIKLEGTKSGQILLEAEFTSNEIQETSMIKETTPISTEKEPKKIIPQPKGRIMLELIKAKELQKKGLFGKPDPYMKIAIGDEKFTSPVIKNNNNPEWKYPLEFNIDESSPKEIRVDIYDEDFGKDDLLGSANIQLSDLTDNPECTNWVPLEEGKTGSILYSSKFIPTEMIGTILDISEGQPDILTQDSNLDCQQKATAVQGLTTKIETISMQNNVSTNKMIIKEEETENGKDLEETVNKFLDNNSKVQSIEIPAENLGNEYSPEVHSRKLVFKLIEGRNLKNTDLVGKADPYVIIKCNDKTFKTKTVNNDLNPKWDFKTELNLQIQDIIELTVFDEDYGKDDKIGKTEIVFSKELTTAQEEPKWISLDNNRGEICYSLSPSQDEQNLIETSVKKPSEIIKEFEQKAENSISNKTKDETTIRIDESAANDEVDTSISEDFVLEDSLPALETIPLSQVYGTLTVHKARNIEDKGLLGKADPYVVVKFGEKTYRSETVNNNLNPEWNFVTNFEINKITQNQASIELYDEDLGKDDTLGKTTIDLQKLLSSQIALNQWFSLDGCKSGEVLISAEVKGNDIRKISNNEQHIIRQTKEKNPKTQPKVYKVGKAKLTVHRGKKLEKRGLFGKVNPFVVLQNKNISLKSQSVKNTTNPEWNFTNEIDVTNEEDNLVTINVFDDGKDDAIGQAVFNLNELILGEVSNKWVRLEKCKTGQILLSGHYIPIPVTTQTQENMSLQKETNDRPKSIENMSIPINIESERPKDNEKEIESKPKEANKELVQDPKKIESIENVTTPVSTPKKILEPGQVL